MAIGDDAAAAGMDLVPSTGATGSAGKVRQGWREINRTRDYIAQRVATVTRAWTTAANAAAARVALGIPAIASPGTVEPSGLAVFDASGKLVSNTPTSAGEVANKAYVDSVVPSLPSSPIFTDVGVTGGFFTPNAYPVTSSFVALYRNGDGRVGLTPSAAKFKKNIRAKVYTLADAARLGGLVVTYQLRADLFEKNDPLRTDAPVEHGVIAEALIEAGFPEFVAFDAAGEPLSVHYERLVLVIAAAMPELLARLVALEERG